MHKTIELTSLEARILDAKCFQRLRNVRQLGLAHYVFPGGDFSRLSHCLGVLHVAGQMLDSLGIANEEVRRDLRMAALVHDIGHLPFSHTMERAIESATAASADDEEIGVEPGEKPWDHQRIGAELLKADPEISRVLSTEQQEKIGRIIQGDSLEVLGYPPDAGYLGRIISSDLDADRIDYLMRTAVHTGLPYGSVDLPYLLSQIQLDLDKRLCFRERALLAVDHTLLGRYFDRATIAFHKTVAGFELVLEHVLSDLVERGMVAGSSASLKALIETGAWCDFDDFQVMGQMRVLRDDPSTPDQVRWRLTSILDRRPPKLIGTVDYLGPTDQYSNFQDEITRVEKCVQELNDGTNAGSWYVWKQPGWTLLSIATGERQRADLPGLNEEEERPKDLLILPTGRRKATSIQKVGASLMNSLNRTGYYAIRVYWLSADRQGGPADAELSKLQAATTATGWRWPKP